MTPLLALPLALAVSGGAQIEAVSLALIDSRPAVLLRCSRAPERVSVYRDGFVARISLRGVELGSQFSGGDRFAWTRASVQAGRNGLFPLEGFRVERGDREISLYLSVAPDVPIRVARAGANVAVLLEAPPLSRPEPSITVAQAAEKPAPSGPANAIMPPPDEGAQAAVAEPGEAPEPTDEGTRVAVAEPGDAPELVDDAPELVDEEAQVAVAEPGEAPVPADEGMQVAVAEPGEASEPIPTLEPEVERLDREPMDEPREAPSSGRELSAELFPAPAPEDPTVPVPEDPPIVDPAAPPAYRDAAELHAQLFPPEIEGPPALAEPGATPAGATAPERGETSELYAGLFPFESGEERGEQALAASLTGTPAGATELAALYTRLFPSTPGDVEPEEVSVEGEDPGEKQPGLALGFLKLRPSLSLTYANAEVNALDTPEPVSDQFLMVQPRLAAEGVLWEGRLRAGYEPVFRSLGSSDTVNSTSHRAHASLALQPGARWSLALSEQFITGTLETQEVDPGREYFFDLARFTRNALSASSRFDVGPRLGVDLSAGFNRVSFEESGGYFGHDAITAGADLGFELTPNLRAAVGYRFDVVPTPDDRPEAESRAHGAQLSLEGEILPLLTGELSLGFRSQQSPNAGEGGQEFRGLTASGFLRKEIGRSSTLSLRFGRSTPLSAFEQNAFYVTTALEASLALPLPLSVAMTSGAGYRWSDYRTIALELGVPREDRIFSWFVGLRRSLSGRAYASVVYSRERRDSNLEGFSNVNDGLSLQLNVDVFQGWNAP